MSTKELMELAQDLRDVAFQLDSKWPLTSATVNYAADEIERLTRQRDELKENMLNVLVAWNNPHIPEKGKQEILELARKALERCK